jgi:hypothetical protein
MNGTQKAALYGLYLVAFMLLIPLVDLVDTKINPVLICAVGCPLAILMVLPLWFLNKKKAEVDMDERDKAIIKRACIIAAAIVTGGLLTVYAASIFTLLPDAEITVSTLQAVVFFALTAFLLVLSLAILIQYGRGGADGR